MSLTFDDLQQIRAILQEELEPIRGAIAALEDDVKELYFMVSK